MSKYHSQRTFLNGKMYDSRREAERARILRLMQKAGEIADLKEQVKFELIPAQYINGKCAERAVTYIADFTYTDKSGNLIVEDAKGEGVRTEKYIIKRKLMLYVYGIRVQEV